MENLHKVQIINEWDVISVRMLVRKFAENLGFNVIDRAKIEIAVSEITRNIIKYAEHGEILFEELTIRNKKGLKIISIDKGIGIEDIDQALIDGFSTSNSLGSGLPSVKRLMDEFEIKSEVGKGTQIIVVKWVR